MSFIYIYFSLNASLEPYYIYYLKLQSLEAKKWLNYNGDFKKLQGTKDTDSTSTSRDLRNSPFVFWS